VKKSLPIHIHLRTFAIEKEPPPRQAGVVFNQQRISMFRIIKTTIFLTSYRIKSGLIILLHLIPKTIVLDV